MKDLYAKTKLQERSEFAKKVLGQDIMMFSDLVLNMDPNQDAYKRNPLQQSKVPNSKQSEIADYFKKQSENVPN